MVSLLTLLTHNPCCIPPHPRITTDDPRILVVVAVVDAPAWEAALLNAVLITGTFEVVHPDQPRASMAVRAPDIYEGICEIQHPSTGKEKERWDERGVQVKMVSCCNRDT